MDESGLSDERRAELAKELGLAEIPKARYDDLPQPWEDEEDKTRRVNFKKAIRFVDVLASARFMASLPNRLTITQELDPYVWKDGWSFSANVFTDKKIPVNRKISAATGITAKPCEANWYGLLSQAVCLHYDYYGARAMSPCLVWRCHGEKKGKGNPFGAHPMVGVIFKLDRTPPDGLTWEDMMANMGLLHDASIQGTKRVQMVDTILPADTANVDAAVDVARSFHRNRALKRGLILPPGLQD